MRCTITKRFWWGLKFIIVPTIIMTNPLMHWRSIDFKSTVLFIRAQEDRSSGNNRVAHTNSTYLHHYVLEKNSKLFTIVVTTWLLSQSTWLFLLIDVSWFRIGFEENLVTCLHNHSHLHLRVLTYAMMPSHGDPTLQITLVKGTCD